MKKTMLAAASCTALAAALHAQAQVGMPTFTFSGYGTLGAAHSNERRADYLVDAFKPNGPGYTDATSFEVDSRLGGQVTAGFTPKLSAVVQVLVQQNHDDTWKPRVEWANIKYQVNDDLSVRLGRIVLPVFMVSDTRRVGYSNPWIRPPVEVYSLVPVTTSDGADVSWRMPLGGWSNTVQLTVGRSEADFPNASGFDAGTAEARKLVALVNTLENGPFSARLSYGEARLTIAAYHQLFDLYRMFGPVGNEIADRFMPEDRRVSFLGLSGSYDPGEWFAMAEFTRFDTRSVVGKRTAWFVSAGPRIGKFTPYATYARIRVNSVRSEAGVSPLGLPPELAFVALTINTALNRQLAALPEQTTTSLGLRWDFWRSAALKLQWDHVRASGRSFGSFGNVQPDFPMGARVNILSAAVDFVF